MGMLTQARFTKVIFWATIMIGGWLHDGIIAVVFSASALIIILIPDEYWN